MNVKEIGEIRRRVRRDRSNMTEIFGCYVNNNKEIISEFRQSTGMMSENESDKYFALLKKVLGGAVGKNLIVLLLLTHGEVQRSSIIGKISAILTSSFHPLNNNVNLLKFIWLFKIILLSTKARLMN